MIIKKSYRLKHVMCFLFLYSVLSMNAQNIIINIQPTNTLSINGISILDRGKYFNLSHPGTNFERDISNTAISDKYIYDLGMSFGRNLGLVNNAINYTKNIQEDASRPGYPDLTYLQNNAKPSDGVVLPSAGFRELFPVNVGAMMHDNHNVYPKFMKKEGTPGSADSLPINKLAAAELAIGLLKNNYTDWSRPITFEPINEPAWQFLDSTMMLPNLADFHLKIWQKAKETNLPTLIGGPCSSGANYYYNNYQQFLKLGKFIDLTQGKLDFYSFHVYDSYGWDSIQNKLTVNVNSGLPLEGVLDALSSWGKNKYNKDFNFASTEHGGQISDVKSRKNYAQYLIGSGSGFAYDMKARSIADFMCVSSAIASTMVFMNHPLTVIKVAPFIGLESFSWDPTYHASLLVANNYTDKTKWYETDKINFYKFFKDVRGRRVYSDCTSPDIQQQIYVDGKKLIIVLNNLSESAETLTLNYPLSNIDSIKIRRVGRNTDFTSAFSEMLVLNTTNFQLSAREAVVAFVYYKSAIAVTKATNEVPYYASQMCKQFSTSATFTVNVPSLSNIDYAYLRIGVSRVAGTNHNLVVTLNGTKLTVPMEKCASRLESSGGYGSTKIIAVNKVLLTSNNTIACSFDDGKMGGIGAVTLIVGVNQGITTVSDIELTDNHQLAICPNPVISEAAISFTLQQASNISIKIYSANGMEVRAIANGLLIPGKYKYNIDAKGLSKGLYMCKLYIDNDIFVKKMLVI